MRVLTHVVPRRLGAGDPSDVLYLRLADDDHWMSFKDFASGSDLDSALALLEHLAEAE